MTDLDAAQTRADASPPEQADQARLAFFKVLADAPLFVMLERDAQNEVLEPRIFDLDEGPVVLAFDTEDRLAAMGEGPMPYAQLPGRVLARLLSAEGLGLGLNLGSAAPSEMLLPLAAMRWLEQMLDQEPDLLAGDFGNLTAPDAELVAALRAILASAPATWGGLAQRLWVYGRDQSALVIVDGAPPEAQIALATALSEALRFAGLGGLVVDIAFADGRALPQGGAAVNWPPAAPPEPAETPLTIPAPGTVRDKPPILR